MALFTWSSMAGGFFSGRFDRNNLDTFKEYFDMVVVNSYCSEDNFKRLDRAKELAKEKGLTIAQVAVAFVLNTPLNVFALLAPANGEEARLNVEAAGLKLTPAEMAWLDLKIGSRT
jgi:aryl-alcohol dehydrogenase-like predicted oxidoreductase